MERRLPVWVFLLCLILWILATVAFGWAAMFKSDRSSTIGNAIYQIAAFPSTAKRAVEELLGVATGDYSDRFVRVRPEDPIDSAGFGEIPAVPGLGLSGLLVKTGPGRIRPGWRVILGAFVIDGTAENAALLVSPDLVVTRAWILEEIAIGGKEPLPKYRKFVHGFDVLPDGSLVFTFDGAISLQRFDACGERIWTTPGDFHHAVTLDSDRASVWTLLESGLAQVSVDDGAILRTVSVEDIIAANPDIDILEIRRRHPNDREVNSHGNEGEWLRDPTHFNDVDPLPPALAARFPQFEPGDLLISARSLNLVFVIDSDTLDVKWWRSGVTKRQHDPDWRPDGTISVYDNRMTRDFSTIVRIDPETFDTSVIVDGEDHGFYSRIRGKHQVLGDGTILVTSPQQGRAFEIDASGERALEFLNTGGGDAATNYVLSEVIWLPPSYFSDDAWACDAAR